MNRILSYGTGIAGFLLVVVGSHAQCSSLRFTAPDKAAGDQAGSSVALHNDRLFFGAPSDDNARGLNAGAVYHYSRSANTPWAYRSKIIPANAGADSHFGAAIAYEGGELFVGAPGYLGIGAVMVFEPIVGGWEQVSLLQGQLVGVGSQAGSAIDTDEYSSVLISGAPRAFAQGGSYAGVINFFRSVNGVWTSETYRHLVGFGTDPSANLGAAVAMTDEMAAAGAPGGNDHARHINNCGVVMVYEHSNAGWDWGTPVVAQDAAPGQRFGCAVDMNEEWMMVGAEGNYEDLFPSSGAIYAFRNENGAWVQTQKIVGTDSGPGSRFGSSVKLSDNFHMVVGAHGDKAAYVFKCIQGTWYQISKQTDPDDSGAGHFGASVAISAGSVAVGDMLDDPSNVSDSGSAYVIELDPNPANDTCSGAQRVYLPTYTGCTTAATASYQLNPCGSSASSPDVWYVWIPTCSGNVIIDTIGSEYDTVLSVHDDCPEPGGESHLVACNDDASGFGRDSLVTFNYTANTTYYIRLSGYNGATGTFTLRVNDWSPLEPANNECADAAVITNGLTQVSTCKATTDGPTETSCRGIATQVHKDVWYHYSAACTGTVTIDTCGSAYDTLVAVYLGFGCPSTPNGALACNDDREDGTCGAGGTSSRLTFSVIQGFQYTIRVGGIIAQQAGGDATISINCAPTPPACECDWNHDNSLNSQDFFDFLTGFFSGNADYNGSGVTNSQDFFDFLTCFFGGC